MTSHSGLRNQGGVVVGGGGVGGFLGDLSTGGSRREPDVGGLGTPSICQPNGEANHYVPSQVHPVSLHRTRC